MLAGSLPKYPHWLRLHEAKAGNRKLKPDLPTEQSEVQTLDPSPTVSQNGEQSCDSNQPRHCETGQKLLLSDAYLFIYFLM